MSNDKAIERVRQHLLDAMARGGPICESSPADHTAQGDTVVEPYRPRVDLQPTMPRSAYVVDEVCDHQRARWSVDEHTLLQSEAVDV